MKIIAKTIQQVYSLLFLFDGEIDDGLSQYNTPFHMRRTFQLIQIQIQSRFHVR